MPNLQTSYIYIPNLQTNDMYETVGLKFDKHVIYLIIQSMYKQMDRNGLNCWVVGG